MSLLPSIEEKISNTLCMSILSQHICTTLINNIDWLSFLHRYDVVACLSETVRNDTLMEKEQRIDKHCRRQLRAELLERVGFHFGLTLDIG